MIKYYPRQKINLSQSEILMMCDNIINSFDLNKTFKLMNSDSWEGYKPKTIDDIRRIYYDDLIKDIKINIDFYDRHYCATAGFTFGIIDDCFYLCFDRERSVFLDIDSIDTVKYMDVYYYINYKNYMRKLKIDKIYGPTT